VENCVVQTDKLEEEMPKLDGKIAVITGGSSGIGLPRRIASRLDPVQARQAERRSANGLNKARRMKTKLENIQWTIDISAVPASAFRH
jgi:NADP-dependent 3-hydroxy acid dehydrogenase YdfG